MADVLLLEAEGFADLGGWVIDQQSMDQMGSPYLLAHGLGVPVADATTTTHVPAPGTHRVWVRTRDWASPWGAAGAPGRFELMVNGRALDTVFGTSGADWHWQDGGTVELEEGKARLALHDLTGFDGRCDAILLTADLDFEPPAGAALREFRRRALGLPDEPEDAGAFDLVVVGGGMAGICAAISAARLGVKVALVHDRPVLGGNNSSEVRVGLSGEKCQPPYPALGNVVEEVGPIGHHHFRKADQDPDSPESRRILAMDPVKRIHNAGPASNYEDDKKLAAVQAEDNIRLFAGLHVAAVHQDGDVVTSVTARDIRRGRELRFGCRLVADCTGDGTVGALAGADWRVGRECRAETGEELAPETADQLVMGTSVQWYATPREQPQSFPECPWAMPFAEETCQRLVKGDWDWEIGIGRDQVGEIESIRDHALRVIYGNWDFLKHRCGDWAEYAKHRLDWVAYIGGKRESRRLLGDVILQQQDVDAGKPYPDACVTATWPIDLHYPAPENSRQFPGQEFRSIAKSKRIDPYPIPYRCLYSRNVSNLFMAGRNISVTHVALGTVRVQKTTGMMGEVVGMAASICCEHDTLPRGVYEQHLGELIALMKRGVGKSLQPSAVG